MSQFPQLPQLGHLSQFFGRQGGGGKTFGDLVRAATPLAWYRLGETSGPTATDSAATPANGTYTGSPTLNARGAVSNDGDGCVKLVNASSQYVDLGNPAKLSIAGNFTLCAWIRQKTQAGFLQIISKSTANGTTENYEFRTDATGTSLECIAEIGGASKTASSAASIFTIGTWYFVSVVYNGSNLQIYLNGVASGSATACSGAVTTNSVNACIGARKPSTADHFFDGWIDEAMIFGSALTAAQLLAMYNASKKNQVTVTSVISDHVTHGTWLFSSPIVSAAGTPEADLTISTLTGTGGSFNPPSSSIAIIYNGNPDGKTWSVPDEPPAADLDFGSGFYLETPSSGAVS